MPSKKPSHRLLLAGWLLAVGWLGTLPGVLPLAFATVAWIDGEHGVELRGSGEAVTVILTHGAQNAGKAHDQIHHHGLLGQMLTCCAQSPRGEADHVLKFTSSSASATERKATAAPLDDDGDAILPAMAATFAVFEVPTPTVGAEYHFALRLRGSALRIPAQQHSLLI